MEHFSESEKKALQQIVNSVNSESYVLANVFNESLDGTGYSFDTRTGELITSAENADVHDILVVQKKLIEIALLVKYLEDNNYIYIISDAGTTETLNNLGAIPSGNLIAQKMPNEIKLLINRTISRIYVSQNLVELVANNFKSFETTQLVVAFQQLQVSSNALNEAIKQTELSKQLVAEAKTQTDSLGEQVDRIKEQTNVVKKQLEEIKKQTDTAKLITEETSKQSYTINKQLNEIKEQTRLIGQQNKASQEQAKQAAASLKEAQEQTNMAADNLKEAHTQTKNSYWAIRIAIFSVVISIALPIIMNKCSSQRVVWEPITEYLDSTLVLTGDTIVDKLQQGNALLENSVEATQEMSKTIKSKKNK